jgi:arabinogalactan endo-1,4-beta-galactosidase
MALSALLLVLALSELLGASSSARPPSSGTDFRVALSVSPFAEIVLGTGMVYSDGKITAKSIEELQRLFVAHGATEVYARIATSRDKTTGFGDHSLNRGLMRARLAKSLGLPFNPELGLFKFYGDVRCQPSPDFSEYPELKVPGVWTSLTLEQMLPILRSYGALVAKTILDTGVKVNVWDLGNEVDFGVAGVSPAPLP